MFKISSSSVDPVITEFMKVFEGHKEAMDKTMDKKLIITTATSGGLVDRRHSPNLPVTTKEVALDVARAWNAGAAMWHFDPRDPETGITIMPLEKRLQIHREWCDAAFQVAPDIITNVGAIYVRPFIVNAGFVDEKSVLAEYRVAPLIEPLIKMGSNNRYVEVVASFCNVAALGPGTNILGFNNKGGITSDVTFLQSKGIRVELTTFNHSDLRHVTEWVIDTGIAQPPVIMDTLLGIHNSPVAASTIEAFELLLTYVRMLPKGVLWQTLIGGRYWLPLTIAAIILGADIVRVGMEDAVYMYPHRDDFIKGNGPMVEAVASIARYLGRGVAKPAEAREIIGLPQIKK
jgi:uncharacterized protein (DUF849 family)